MDRENDTRNDPVRVGPAGWSYDDWQEIVYPAGNPARRLELVASLFPVIEVNSTFYRSPTARTTSKWLQRIEHVPGFQFTAKLVQLFTHEDPSTWTLKGRDEFRDGLEPLREAGRLAALLVQFPWFYAATDDNVHRLSRIRKAFLEHRLVLEVRHNSWLAASRLEAVSSLGYSFCNTDQPSSRTAIPLDCHVTGPIGYLRLHGRNADKWFSKDAAVHEKYDYLYSRNELEQVVTQARKLMERTEQLFVIANNHFAGKGPANALEVQHALTGKVPEIPEMLAKRYPHLQPLKEGGPTEASGSNADNE